MNQPAIARRTVSVVVLLAIAGTTGCAGPEEIEARPVSLAEFARPVETPEPEPGTDPVDGAIVADEVTPAAADIIATAPPAAAAEAPAKDAPSFRLGAADPAAEAAAAQARLREAKVSGEERVVLVDSLVGQVNGRPIFADVFFEPIEDQLRATSRRLTIPRQFVNEASGIVFDRLRQVVLDELFLAEAESNLSEQQRVGLRYWLQDIQEGLISEKGSGSRSQAEARLMEQEGIDFDTYMSQMRERALTAQLYRERIQQRVIVSWRDVEREYRRRYDEFNPPGTMVLYRIRLNTTRRPEQIEQVKDYLADDDDFMSVATAVGMRNEGFWAELELGPDGIKDSDLNEAIRSRIEPLEVGQTTEPFEVGSSTWWLHLAEMRQPETRDLYDEDLQRILMDQIRQRRQAEEQNVFIDSLLEDGIYDEINVMAERLIAIAVHRYGPRIEAPPTPSVDPRDDDPPAP